MNTAKKELYVQPALVKHELLRDITATRSGLPTGFDNGGRWRARAFEFSGRRSSPIGRLAISRSDLSRGWPVRKNRPACLLNPCRESVMAIISRGD